MRRAAAFRVFLVTVGALGAGFLLSGCFPLAAPPPPMERFDNPPYTRIVDGVKPDPVAAAANIPAFPAGMKAAFFATADDQVRAVYCDRPLIIRPRAPVRRLRVQIASAEGGIVLHGVSVAMATSTKVGGIELAQAEGTVVTESHGAALPTEAATGHVAAAEQTGGMTGAAAAGEVEVATADTGQSMVVAEGPQVGQAVESTTMRTAESELAIGEDIEIAASLRARMDKDLFRIFTGRDLLRIVQDKDLLRLLIDRSIVQILRDKDALAALREKDLLEVFLERLTLPAYFDKDGKAIKLDKTFAVSATERDRIIDLVERGGKLAGLLTGPASAGRRAASRPAAGATYGGRLTLEAIPMGVYYGHKMGLMISLTNTGGGALFDTAIFNGLPARTQFVRFAVDAEAARGYFPYFSKRRKTIVVKLDRPIAPGESFRILVVLRADPWLLSTPAIVPVSLD